MTLKDLGKQMDLMIGTVDAIKDLGIPQDMTTAAGREVANDLIDELRRHEMAVAQLRKQVAVLLGEKGCAFAVAA